MMVVGKLSSGVLGFWKSLPSSSNDSRKGPGGSTVSSHTTVIVAPGSKAVTLLPRVEPDTPHGPCLFASERGGGYRSDAWAPAVPASARTSRHPQEKPGI